MSVASEPQVEHSMTTQDAIEKLQSLQRYGGEDGSNVHANADTILCDFLDAIGYGEIAREFRKVYEIYPTVTPRYRRPSWRV
jgi:hypothetical protein